MRRTNHTSAEYLAYGLEFPDAATRIRQLDEAVQIIQRAWTAERFSYDGRYFQIPEVRVIPKPLQRPHPPLYQVCVSPDSIEGTALRSWPIVAAAESSAKTGLIAMIGKAERGPAAIESIKKHKSAYLMAVGGAAYLVSKAIKTAKVVGFEDLGMEAIYEFEVKDMPVTVAVDSTGNAVHKSGPAQWRARIGKIPVAVV